MKGKSHGIGRTLAGPVPPKIEAVDEGQTLSPIADIQVAVRQQPL